jgi:adenylate kinase
MRLLLLAPPGAGKGTQGARLADRLGVQHVAAGATAAAALGARLGLTLQAVVYLYASETVLVRRLLDRAGQDGRGDDTAAVIRHRLDVFTTTTSPLIDYYRGRGILLSVDAEQPPGAVTTEILSRLSDRSPTRGNP